MVRLSVAKAITESQKPSLSKQSPVGGEVDKKMMWGLGKSILKSLFRSVHTMSAGNKESLLRVPENAGAQQEELTLLSGH